MERTSMYNIFVVYDIKKRKPKLVTSSARKADEFLYKGFRVDVWNNNELVCVVYCYNAEKLNKYIDLEKQYIARKQKKATQRNWYRKHKNILGGS